MYRLYHQYKDRELLYILPLVFLSLAVNLGYFFKVMISPEGFPTSDDSEWYLNYAYSMLEDFQISLHMNDILYMGYNMLLTLLLAVFKDPAAVLFLQATTTGLSVMLVYAIAGRLFNRTTAVIASVFYSFSSGIIRWTTYVITDSFFISLLLLCVYLVLRCFESDKKRYKVLLAASALLMVMFRPAGILTLAFLMLYILIRLGKTTVFGFLKTYRYVLGGGVIAVIGIGVYLLASGKLDPLLASMQENIKMVLYNIYATGWIYDKSTPYDHTYTPNYEINIMNSLIVSFLINNWDHILILYGKRMISFLGWWVWRADFGSLWGVVSFVRHAFPTLLFFIGSGAAIAAGRFRKASVLWLVILAVFVFCVIFFIDVMYRYKAPALPFIAIISAYGAERLFSAALGLFRRYKRD